MATLIEDTKGKIRDRPIQASLKTLLISAASHAGIDLVRVTSGGQAKKGTPGKRTGSTRHDEGFAADLMIEISGKALSFAKSQDLPYFKAFVTYAAQLGATGIGAGVDYMGPLTLHVGYGSEAVWGAGGKAANAPGWLKEAFAEGRKQHGKPLKPMASPAAPPVAPVSPEMFVNARTGLNLRAGPGTGFASLKVIPAGAHVFALGTAQDNWQPVDLQNDGLVDGFVFASYLSAV